MTHLDKVRNLGEEITVDALMTSDVFTLSTKDSLLMVIEALDGKGIRHVPVLDDHGRVCGVVTRTDVLAFAPSQTSGLSPGQKSQVLGKYTGWDLLLARTREPVVAVEPSGSLAVAAP